MALNNQALLDAQEVMTGKDGQLFLVTEGGDPVDMATVDAFTVQMNVSNTDYQPIGSQMTYAVNTAYSVTLTLTEAVINNDFLLQPLYDAISMGKMPQFAFQGSIITGNSATPLKQVFRNCIPDGTVDLMNITPGEVIKRSWSFRVNAAPEIQ